MPRRDGNTRFLDRTRRQRKTRGRKKELKNQIKRGYIEPPRKGK